MLYACLASDELFTRKWRAHFEAGDAVSAIGADPRQPWASDDSPWSTPSWPSPTDAGRLQRPPLSSSALRALPRRLRRLHNRKFHNRYSVFEQPSDLGGITWCVEPYSEGLQRGVLYVPCDVARWRDPEHRAWMRRRAVAARETLVF